MKIADGEGGWGPWGYNKVDLNTAWSDGGGIGMTLQMRGPNVHLHWATIRQYSRHGINSAFNNIYCTGPPSLSSDEATAF